MTPKHGVDSIYTEIESFLHNIVVPEIPELVAYADLMKSPNTLRQEMYKFGQHLIELTKVYNELRAKGYYCRELLINPPTLPSTVVNGFRRKVDEYVGQFVELETTLKQNMRNTNDVIEVLRSISASTRIA